MNNRHIDVWLERCCQLLAVGLSAGLAYNLRFDFAADFIISTMQHSKAGARGTRQIDVRGRVINRIRIPNGGILEPVENVPQPARIRIRLRRSIFGAVAIRWEDRLIRTALPNDATSPLKFRNGRAPLPP